MRQDTDTTARSGQAAPGDEGIGRNRPAPPLTYVRFGERPLRRMPQLFIGLALYGFSMAVMVRAALGLSPGAFSTRVWRSTLR